VNLLRSLTDVTVHTAPGHRSGAWVWALLATLVAAAVLAGPSVVAVLTAGAGNARRALTSELRAHGRAILTSGVALVWAITYTVYSVAVTPAARVIVTGGASGAGSALAGPGGANQAAGAALGVPGVPGTSGPIVYTPSGQIAAGAGGLGAGLGAAGGAGGARGAGGSAATEAGEAGLPPAAHLYTGADDRIGITNTAVTLCGHAALTFGPAFNIDRGDLNVFWHNLNDHGGIYGRKFNVDWKDDEYQPGPAVTAAQACKDQGTFVLLGGIGFDQIPAVRVWAEQNHELYLHHDAVLKGAENLKYSFSALPTVEVLGHEFGELAVQKYRGMKLGILWRNSSDWQPGRDEFRKVVLAAGMQIAYDAAVENGQSNYTQQIVEMKGTGVQVVFAWENALAATEMIRQAKAQAWSPHWLLFPFNLTLQTIRADALNPPLDGVAAWPAYTFNDHTGPYASYASDLVEFEREYKQYDPNANLGGAGGDLLFLAWSGFKALADMFRACGPDCTRNKFAGLMLAGYHKTTTPNCDTDWSVGDHHHAAPRMDILTTTAGPGGEPIWVPTHRCVAP